VTYGMYTERGNKLVDEIVQDMLSMPDRSFDELATEAVGRLLELSDVKGCEEAMDTDVRERTFAAIEEGLKS